MYDWRQVGEALSIYGTPLGVALSAGQLHSGTTFAAEVELPPDVESDIRAGWLEHKAYPVLRLMPHDEAHNRSKGGTGRATEFPSTARVGVPMSRPAGAVERATGRLLGQLDGCRSRTERVAAVLDWLETPSMRKWRAGVAAD